MILTAVMSACLSACAQGESRPSDKGGKAIVVYFSATGTTRQVARQLAAVMTDADMLEIEPAQPYTAADLDWTDRKSRSSVEMNSLESRPAIRDTKKDIEGYDVVFIGYPIWWNLAPTVVNTFIEHNKLNGKKVVPFATSGGNSINNSVLQLRRLYPEIDWADGKLLNAPTEESIGKWVESLNL